MASCGLVPHVTVGAISFASITTVLSNTAPSSVLSVFQYSTALSHSSPEGHMGRPFKYSNVTSSGAIIPARAPASMAMLEILIRASILSDSIASPANSIVAPVPPAVPITLQTCKMMSLEVTPSPSGPSIRINILIALVCGKVCVANTCSTSLVPIPNANAPNAPWVAVCESPQTVVHPGRVNPCSGPIMWTIPCRSSSIPKYLSPKSSTLVCICTT
mmetsp:Transcript_3637/g.5257  ORF Transcript_3637/g.5257 Transcript_3637/m.5257 type:complete len:217 (-) Transcript_3637:657-1307(-)